MRWMLLNILMVVVTLLSATGTVRANDLVRISNAWIREGPPITTVLAGYAKAENLSGQEIVLIGATSPDFAAVEFHRTDIVNGLARMREEGQIKLPRGAAVSFHPGGRHMMLINPRRTLKAGENVRVELRLGNGQIIRIDVPVRRQAPDG